MKRFKEIVRKIYEFKIYTTTRFNWGFSEIASYVNLVKDVAIILGFVVLVFHIHVTLRESIIICIVLFLLCVLAGIALEKTGMLKYGADVSNRQNPAMNKIDEIYERLSQDPGSPTGSIPRRDQKSIP